jgi:hypothetical protein
MNWKAGDRALVKWSQDDFWYPATIQQIDGERLFVRFDDGDKEWTVPDHVMEIDIDVGDRVYGRWQAGQYYYPGKVAEKREEEIYIHYDDGDKEWTTISMVRVTRGIPPSAKLAAAQTPAKSGCLGVVVMCVLVAGGILGISIGVAL